MKKVCILYGFGEGPQVSKRFCAMLKTKGFTLCNDPRDADIIIAHSGGCFLLPRHIRAERIIHIGTPYWPGRSLLGSIWCKFKTDLASHHREGAVRFWIRKTFWNIVYFWKMPANIRMLKGRSQGNLWRHGDITTVIRPSLDTFCTSNLRALPFSGKASFVAVPGHHDECWRNTDPYIDIVVQ